jgi:phosphoenolpyruvate synthase/pyruvate phosphate dikinase
MESSRAYKRGFKREDGKIFWTIVKRKYEYWITEEKYNEFKKKNRLYDKKYSNKEESLIKKKERNKKYYLENIENERERTKKRIKNMAPDEALKLKEYKRNWHKKNVFRKMASKHRRREREKNNTPLTKNQIAIIATLYKQSKRLKKTLGIEFHVDHIIPLFMGGKHNPSNLQVIPATINLRKSYNKIFVWSEKNS